MHLEFSEVDQQFLQEMVSSEQFASEDAVIIESVKRFRKQQYEQKLADLRAAIDIGEADYQAGRYRTYDSTEDMIADIIDRGEKRFKQENL